MCSYHIKVTIVVVVVVVVVVVAVRMPSLQVKTIGRKQPTIGGD